MKKLIIGLLFCPHLLLSTQEQWIEHTYRNELDNPVKIITHYTQITQRFVQPRQRRRVVSQKISGSAAHTINPHESKTITVKGDALSSHRLIPGSIRVFDVHEHDHAIIRKNNVQDRHTFVISRNKRDKLIMQPMR